MFNLISGLTKAVVSVAVTPVALAVDVALIPAKIGSDDPNSKIFGATEACVKSAAEGIDEAGK